MRKILTILLAVLTAVSLAACGSKSKKDVQSTGQSNKGANLASMYEDNKYNLFRFGALFVIKGNEGWLINKSNEVISKKISGNFSDCGLSYFYPVLTAPVNKTVENPETRMPVNVYGYYDLKGNPIIDTDKYTMSNESCTYGMLSIMDLKTFKVGYCDLSGNVVIEPQFEADEWFPFANCDLSAVKLDGKYGYVDKTGKMVIEAQFDSASNFDDEGVAAVGKKGNSDDEAKYALINTEGKLLTDYIFDEVDHYFSGSLEMFVDGKGFATKDGERFVIDSSGNILRKVTENDEIKSVSDLVEQKRMGGRTVFAENGLYGIKDEDGKTVVQPVYKTIASYNCGKDYFIAEKEDGENVVCDYSGNVKVKAGDIGEAVYFSRIYDDGYIVAQKSDGDDRRCVIDTEGNVVIPFEYERIN